ncbi:MAG: hypothetical protein JNN05_00555 [Candidatus Omnitrophica bacterium]|nr:hypothetical protein [Candidatus Omnitrophota bacterium]
MRGAGIVSIVLILVYAALAVAQLWLEAFDPEVFIKLTITFAIVIIAVVVVALIRREYVNDEMMRKNKQIG